MTPDEIRVFLSSTFPALVAVERHNPNGWSLFYQQHRTGARIITATRSTPKARTKLLRAISKRLQRVQGYATFEGSQNQLRQVVAQEIRLYQDHFSG